MLGNFNYLLSGNISNTSVLLSYREGNCCEENFRLEKHVVSWLPSEIHCVLEVFDWKTLAAGR